MIFSIGVIASSSLLSQSYGIQSKCPTNSKMTLPLLCKLNLLKNQTYDVNFQFYYTYKSSKNLQASHGFEIARGGCHMAPNLQLVWAHSLHASPCSISTSIFSCIYLFISFIKYLCNSNVQTSLIFPLIPHSKASSPNLGTSNFPHWQLFDPQHQFGKLS